MAYLWNPQPAPVFDLAGELAAGALAFFYADAGTTPLTVYRDPGLKFIHEFPVAADVSGVFPPVYIPYGTYGFAIYASDMSHLLRTAFGVDATTPPPNASGGFTPTPEAVWQTGDMMFDFSIAAPTGFVNADGLTIGNAASGATGRANADTADLFAELWDGLGNAVAPVSGGRGASAAADFAAGKTIVVPDMAGFTPAGVEDALGTVLQTVTTCSATNGLPTITVASASGVVRGWTAVIDGVATGAVVSVSGTAVTLSSNYAGATGAGKAVRFSPMGDATISGAAGGGIAFMATLAELAAHTHAVVDPTHDHAYTPPSGNSKQGGAIPHAQNGGPGGTVSSATGISLQNTGGGRPIGQTQPSRVVVWHVKL